MKKIFQSILFISLFFVSIINVVSAETFFHEKITVGDTAVGPSVNAGDLTTYTQVAAIITVEGGSVRCLWEGTTPTTSAGHLINEGDVIILDNLSDILRFRAIRTGVTTTIITISYKR